MRYHTRASRTLVTSIKTVWLSWLLVTALALTSTVPAVAQVLPTDVISDSTVEQRNLTISDVPDVAAQSGILIDSNGKVLWSRDPDSRRAMASITKVMTAVVALEHLSPDEIVTVPPAAVTVGESSANLKSGEQISVKELIEGLLVPSGNDAAVALAVATAGDVDSFVGLMNKKAEDIGMKGIHFTNPHGLEDPDHYTTANDLALLVRYAMNNELIAATVSQPSVEIEHSWGARTVESTNRLLGTYEGANGVKTGFTDEAGYCLASGAKRGDIQLWAVVLHSDTENSRFADSESLFDWGFAHYQPMSLASAGQSAAHVAVADYLDRTVPAGVESNVALPVFDFDGPIRLEATFSEISSPIRSGDVVGSIKWTQGKQVIATAKLVALEDVESPSFFGRVSTSVTRLWRGIFGGQKVAKSSLELTAPTIIDPVLNK